jgi:HK97 gp10 family phage protein
MADSIKVRSLKEAGTETDRLEEGDTREGFSTDDVAVHLWIGPDRKHFYGFFGEFGTVHQSERPFMRPAFDHHAKGVIDGLSVELWKGIERAAKKLAKTT